MRITPSLALRWLGGAASSLDVAAARATAWQTQRGTPRVGKLSHEGRLDALSFIRRTYDEPRFVSSPELFFPEPPPAHPQCVRVREMGSSRVFDASWPSRHVPFSPDFRDAYVAHENNRTAHARLILAPEPRPVVIALHGYLGGPYAFEERAFPVRWMVRRGFDVALAVLPFHALRSTTDRTPPFPGADPRYTIEGCRQAVHDVRALIGYLLERGAPAVGVMGMSLGGYTTSLLATLDARLSFAIPIIPLASFADFARDQGRLGSGARADAQYEAYDEALRVVSPLARPSLLLPERVLVLAAEHDRITPIAHAERLAAHFGSRLVTFPGGHLLQFGRGEAFREIGRFWRGLGLGRWSRSDRLP
jgi:pimeloyl-ACP methyl ester carboxylesterase